jgi:meiotic recombination protein SPO11
VTKRDLFYTDVKLFEKQTASDSVLEEMGCMFLPEPEFDVP